MEDSQHRLTALEEQVTALQMRLAALEGRISSEAFSSVLPQNRTMTTLSPHGQQQQPGMPAVEGMLSYGGQVQFLGKPLQMHRQQQLAALFEAAPETVASVFAALASPHRVTILRLLYQGPHSRQQLQDLLGMGSAGQLYHHLKELLGLGLIIQQKRNLYSLDSQKVIPIYIALMVATNLGLPSPRADEPYHREPAGPEQS